MATGTPGGGASGDHLALMPTGTGLGVPGAGGASAATRVMSPTQRSLNEGILIGLHATCQVCTQGIYEPAVCAMCGRFGHPICLGMERFADYLFCGACVPQAIQQYAAARDQQHREQWRRELAEQIATWKSRTVTAIGVGSTLGLAVGSAVATAAGAAAGLARGAIAGATAVTSAPRPALEDAAGADAPAPEPARPRLRRSRSQDFSGNVHCVACWTPNTSHKAHTYCGDCAVVPGRALWTTATTTSTTTPAASRPALADGALAQANGPAAEGSAAAAGTAAPAGAAASAGPPLRLDFGPDQGSVEDQARASAAGDAAGFVPRPSQLPVVGPASSGSAGPAPDAAVNLAVPGSHGSLFNSASSRAEGSPQPEADRDADPRYERLESLVKSLSNELHSLREDFHEALAHATKRDMEMDDLTSRLETLEFNWAEGVPGSQ